MLSLCLVGDILVDVTLKNLNEPLKMRLGGIIHSARAIWAISAKYSIGYIAPTYLDPQIHNFLPHIGHPSLFKIADTLNAPNLILIEEAREIGNQGYELILRENINYHYHDFISPKCDRYLITSGQYDIQKVLKNINGAEASLEIANLSLDDIKYLNYKFNNLYISTSSEIFKSFASNETFNFIDFAFLFKDFCTQLILKENRGGTRIYDFVNDKVFQVSSQTKPIQHSVGVGDVFNTIYELNIFNDIEKNLTLASYIAMEYASTTFPENFKRSVERVLRTPISDLVSLKGVVLNWEARNKINIYIAAPDFNSTDTSLLDKLESSLLYHNFTPRRPVRENGEMKESDLPQKKRQFYDDDMKVLDECAIVVAVLLFNDPGTLVEIGIAAERRIPVLLFDPFNQAKNCMLTNSCRIVTDNMDEIISEIFIISSKL